MVHIDPKDGLPVIPFSDAGENWTQTIRLERLRARGWQGSFEEWAALFEALGADPLLQDPPITKPR
jgi:hypothetical protein